VSISRFRIAAAAFLLVGCVAVLPVGVANADCTTPGDFGAGAGCAPPDSSSGSGKAESWPPTSVDWPPQLDSDTGSDGKSGGDSQSTPIVMPNGEKPPPAKPSSGSDSTRTSTPKPIVPVASAPAATTTTSAPIVTAHG